MPLGEKWVRPSLRQPQVGGTGGPSPEVAPVLEAGGWAPGMDRTNVATPRGGAVSAVRVPVAGGKDVGGTSHPPLGGLGRISVRGGIKQRSWFTFQDPCRKPGS